jgi:hypothetical protein
MTQAPYKEARRVFLIVDNGSAHRGSKSVGNVQKCLHGLNRLWLKDIPFLPLERCKTLQTKRNIVSHNWAVSYHF